MARERVKAGMNRARGEGKQVGRSQQKWTPDHHQLWLKVVSGLAAGTMTRREAAKPLGLGYQALQTALASNGIEGGLKRGVAQSPPR
jgi:DNA invertase Pin-like site-specific DNA recombinase